MMQVEPRRVGYAIQWYCPRLRRKISMRCFEKFPERIQAVRDLYACGRGDVRPQAFKKPVIGGGDFWYWVDRQLHFASWCANGPREATTEPRASKAA